MNFLFLTNVALSDSGGNAGGIDRIQARGSKFLFFDDPVRLLAVLTPGRMEIIRLLCEEGPMTEESISLAVARDNLSVRRDLECLLDMEIIDLDRDASYLFGFNRMRVTCDYPTPRAGKPR
jgi:predicted transcriptional regulator